MENNYSKAYKETYEILRTLSEEDVNKIPKEMIKMFEVKMDKEYDFKIDLNKTFEEQNFSDITKAIIANLFRDYWATSEQRERIIAKENQERQILEEKKRAKYNTNDIFKNKKNIKIIESEEEKINVSNSLYIEAKKECFIKKIIEFIRNIFHL